MSYKKGTSKSSSKKHYYGQSKYAEKPKSIKKHSYVTCRQCKFFNDGICTGTDRTSFAVNTIYIASTCQYFKNKVDDDENARVAFVEIISQNWKKENGKFIPNGSSRLKGLKIDSDVILLNGKIKDLSANGNYVAEIYDYIPHWANDMLITAYNREKRKA